MSRLAVFTLCALVSGCLLHSPAAWTVSVDQSRTDPAAPTADAPVAVVFRVTCQRTGGSGNKPVKIRVAARLVGKLKVYTGEVDCSVTDSPQEGVTFLGLGRIDLGKLPPGRYQVELTFSAFGEGWTMPPPHPIDFTVADAGR